MSIRRRLAVWFDPSYPMDGYLLADIADNTRRIAKALESIDRKTSKRRPRVVECRHPELHPEEVAA